MSFTRPILIAGAGIGGLSLALLLARKGVSTVLVERALRIEEVGAGIQLSPNASRILDRLGLGPALDEAGVQPARIRLIDGKTGTPLTQIPLGFDAERRWGAPYRLIHRAALQQILASAVQKADIDLRLGTELVDCAATAKGVVAHLRSPNIDESFGAGALVGADGVRSSVRTGMGDANVGFSGQIAWRATVHLPTALEANVWLGPGAHLVTYPIDRNGMLNMVAVTRGNEASGGWSQTGSRAELMSWFASWSPQVRRLLEAADTWLTWPLYNGRPAKIGEGRVTLIGDAAHPVLPHLAQGAGLAIEDAAVLAARLEEFPDDPATAFRAYENERASRTAAVQNASRRNGEIFRLSGAAAFARDTVLRVLGPERLMARYDWVYGYRAR